MASSPISEVVINVNRKAIDALDPTFAAVERGYCLTKAVYVAKESNEGTDVHYALHCAVFRNSDFEGCLHYLKERAKLPTRGVIRMTGTNCEIDGGLVETVLGLHVDFVTEYSTVYYHGLSFLLSNAADRESLFYPPTQPDKLKELQLGEGPVQTTEESHNNIPYPNDLLPCVMVRFGTQLTVALLHPNGTAKVLEDSMIGGGSLLTMAKTIADTDDYDELMALARTGNHTLVDTTIEELLNIDPNNPYGDFPKNFPVHSFGKLLKKEKRLHDFERKDRAAATVRHFAVPIVSLIAITAASAGMKQIIVGGQGARSEVMRCAFDNNAPIYTPGNPEYKFLRDDSCGAVGAMVLGKHPHHMDFD